jgi:hypothetical protein
VREKMNTEQATVFIDKKRPGDSKKIIKLLKKADYQVVSVPNANLATRNGTRVLIGRKSLEGEKEVKKFLKEREMRRKN